MTLVAIRLLDRAGRRPLLLWGSAVMAVALSLLAFVFILGAGSTAGSLVAIGSLMLYVGAFAISLGPIFWLLNSEIYPLRVRSKAAAVGTMANWFFNFLVSLTFLLLIDALGNSGAFFFYSAVCVRHVLLLPPPRPGDEGQASGGHPGDLPRARRRPHLSGPCGDHPDRVIVECPIAGARFGTTTGTPGMPVPQAPAGTQQVRQRLTPACPKCNRGRLA